MKRQTKRKIKYFLIMAAVFLCAFIFYLLLSYRQMEKSQTVYASIEEAKLPLVYALQDGEKLNPMHAYLLDMGNAAGRDSISVLPEDRRLTLCIEEYDKTAISVQYEVRTLDLDRLLEKGSISNIQHQNGEAEITLPLQNLLEQDTPYLLKLTVDTGEQILYYYTRILWTQKDYSAEMLTLARQFTEQSFSKTEARGLTGYLETAENADNSSLNHVTLQSSFNQITWGDSGMQLEGEITTTLREFDGVMAEVQLNYRSSCSDAEGNTLYFDNEDNFVLRYDPTRIYMMNFDRRTEQRLSTPVQAEGKRLQIGVTDPDSLESMSSDSGQFTCFITGEGLFRYDSKAQKLSRLFSFTSETDSSIRSDYPAHGVKVLRVLNNGDVDFAVYGYMNRGSHEGYTGLLYESYDNSEDTLRENVFIPLAENYEELCQDFEKLLYLNQEGMLYFYYDGNVLGIDSNSSEVMNLVGGLGDTEIAVSADGRYLAFQDATADTYHSGKLTLMDLETESSQELQEDGRAVRVLGYIGTDLIYGVADASLGDVYTENGEIPAAEIKIRAADGSTKTDYQKDGLYFSDMKVTKGRVSFDELSYDGSSFRKAGSDSIISNRETEENQVFTTVQNGKLEKLVYLNIPELGSKTVQEHKPKSFSVEGSTSIDISGSLWKGEKEALMLCYTNGHLIGKARTMAAAITLVYDDFGYVVDTDQNILWNRSNRKNICSIRSPQDKLTMMQSAGLDTLQNTEETEDMILLNLSGTDLNSVLYYVSHGMPVLAYTDSLQLIYGYDAYNVSLLHPETGETSVMGREDAAALFRQYDNHFVSAIQKNG